LTFELGQNYPNPFNASTVIRYNLPETSDVEVSVHDILGRRIAVLVSEQQPLGSYSVPFHAYGLSSGVYLYRLKAGGKVLTSKMLLLK
jgi:hypothetical protein